MPGRPLKSWSITTEDGGVTDRTVDLLFRAGPRGAEVVDPEEVVEPEVVVRSLHRRRTRPPPPATPPPVNLRNWVVYFALALGVAWLMFEGFLSDHPTRPPLPSLSQATDVRSTLAETAGSLQVVVGWDFTLSDPEGLPDSVVVRVIPEPQTDSLTATRPARQLTDTAYLPAPAAGQTAQGLSCVAAQHPGRPLQEVCTPWQYVRPAATAAATVLPRQIVVQPSGLQVDPDVGGRCAEWHRTHSPDSVWIEMNRKAVPECTGPNQKPTVAQFCAFAVLPDGRRIKTANSINNRYCDELFAEWIRERVS